MSLKSRVVRILTKLERRATLAEDSVERSEAVVLDVLAITTELRAAAANLQTTANQLKAAVAEQGDTLANAMQGMRDESKRRAGLGKELMRESARLDEVERRLNHIEEGRPNGAA
jgi:hypothetical protein